MIASVGIVPAAKAVLLVPVTGLKITVLAPVTAPALVVRTIEIAPVVELMATLATLSVAVGAVQPELRSLEPLAAFSATVVLAASAITIASETRARTV